MGNQNPHENQTLYLSVATHLAVAGRRAEKSVHGTTARRWVLRRRPSMTGRSGISRATEGVWQEVERNFSRQLGRRGADGAQCESTREFLEEMIAVRKAG